VSVTKQLIAARCNVDLQTRTGATALQLAEDEGHARIATLIRNKKLKSADMLTGGRRILYCRLAPRR
jgi:hypothetical protein